MADRAATASFSSTSPTPPPARGPPRAAACGCSASCRSRAIRTSCCSTWTRWCICAPGGHYTDVFTRGGRYLCNLSLADLEGRLDPERFLRVHRSHIVNLGYAAALARREDRYLLTLEDHDATEVPISRSQVQRVKGAFGLV